MTCFGTFSTFHQQKQIHPIKPSTITCFGTFSTFYQQKQIHPIRSSFTHNLISCHKITIYFNYKQWLFLWQMFVVQWNFLNFFEKSCFSTKVHLFCEIKKREKKRKGKIALKFMYSSLLETIEWITKFF
jgi:hypothetical protein